MSNYHVTIANQGGWSAKKAGAGKAAGIFKTQLKAEKAAKIFSANSGGGEVRIHGLDGKIRDSDTVSPGRDPNPPKDIKF
ncbi:DUF2188 domain-containing protein [Patescibacteria group bacterium]|nr:DUF2188 domain-containing protein [Patescibacteria group bacterium]